MYARQDVPAQRVPAWKRLGLKLKAGATDSSPTAPAASASPAPSSAAQPQRPNLSGSNSHAAGALAASSNTKRSHPTPDRAGTAAKRPRREDAHQPSPALKRQKSVTFAEDTKPAEQAAAAAGDSSKPKKPKKKKTGPKKATEHKDKNISLEPSLGYLRQWHNSRDTWKFNKNHQTLLIKYVFEGTAVPSADIDTFYAYISDLKGFVRTRLRETAQEIRNKDMEQGAAGFPTGVQNVEAKQEQYEQIISRLLQVHRTGPSSNSTAAKRTFDEVAFLMEKADEDVQLRVLKRMRAEMVADELSDSDESSASAGSTATTSSGDSATQGASDVAMEKRVKLNDGSQQKVRRRRKVRTGVDDDSDSDADSDSASSSGSNSDSSSSSDESDDEMELAAGPVNAETSSSSSSSSSSSEAEPVSDSDLNSTDEDTSADEGDESESGNA